MSITIGCIIQARMGSTRFPGKVMMKIDEDKPVISYVLTQLKNCKFIEKIVVATTFLQEDDQIYNYVTSMGFDCYRGSEIDVLDRYYHCAKKFCMSTIVRITCDNPLIDPTLVDDVIEKFNSNSYDYVANCIPRTFPHGTEVEVFSFKALEEAWKKSIKPSEREHVTPYLRSKPNTIKIFNITYHKDISHLRWTIDRKSDLEFVRKLAKKIKKRPILMIEILETLKKEPHLSVINKHVSSNE